MKPGNSGGVIPVKWTNTSGKNVRVELIKGLSFVLASGTLSNTATSYSLNFPVNTQAGSDYKIRVTSVDNYGGADYKVLDDSDNYFTITSAIIQPSITVTSPVTNSTVTNKNIRVAGTCSNYNGAVKVFYYSDKEEPSMTQCILGQWYSDIYVNSNAISGSFDIYAQLYPNTGTSIQDKIKVYFNWPNAQVIKVYSPNGGEVWKVGESHAISWSSSGYVGGTFRVSLIGKPDSGGAFAEWVINSSNTGNFSWTIPAMLEGEGPIPIQRNDYYKIRVYHIDSLGNMTMYDDSDNYFTITSASTQPSITVTSPNGGETLTAGQPYNITWTQTGLSATNKIMLTIYNNGIVNYTANYGYSRLFDIATLVPINQGNYIWNIPTDFPPGSNYVIKIQNQINEPAYYPDQSDANFSIVAPTAPVTTTETSKNDSFLTAQRLFPGQYDNTKYSLTLTDSDGLGDIIVKKANGQTIWSGSPRSGTIPCQTSINSGTMTFLSSDFPLTGTVVDCKSSTIYQVSIPMPAL